uniref:Uncharacterized protein n=1 Tax=Mustela putorius furo TaxID=9669 RepID=M3Z5T2_MUSPF
MGLAGPPAEGRRALCRRDSEESREGRRVVSSLVFIQWKQRVSCPCSVTQFNYYVKNKVLYFPPVHIVLVLAEFYVILQKPRAGCIQGSQWRPPAEGCTAGAVGRGVTLPPGPSVLQQAALSSLLCSARHALSLRGPLPTAALLWPASPRSTVPPHRSGLWGAAGRCGGHTVLQVSEGGRLWRDSEATGAIGRPQLLVLSRELEVAPVPARGHVMGLILRQGFSGSCRLTGGWRMGHALHRLRSQGCTPPGAAQRSQARLMDPGYQPCTPHPQFLWQHEPCSGASRADLWARPGPPLPLEVLCTPPPPGWACPSPSAPGAGPCRSPPPPHLPSPERLILLLGGGGQHCLPIDGVCVRVCVCRGQWRCWQRPACQPGDTGYSHLGTQGTRTRGHRCSHPGAQGLTPGDTGTHTRGHRDSHLAPPTLPSVDAQATALL